MGCKAAEGDFVISKIAKRAVLKGCQRRRWQIWQLWQMTVSYSGRGMDDENVWIIPLLYIIYILYIIMNLEQSIRGKVCGGKWQLSFVIIVIFLVERCLDTLRDGRKMTNMTNDSVIFWAWNGWWKYENYIIIIYNMYIIYNNEFRTEFCEKGVWGEMTIVICHNCHFLEKMSGHTLRTPCGRTRGLESCALYSW